MKKEPKEKRSFKERLKELWKDVLAVFVIGALVCFVITWLSYGLVDCAGGDWHEISDLND